jgi:hypothetical protein
VLLHELPRKSNDIMYFICGTDERRRRMVYRLLPVADGTENRNGFSREPTRVRKTLTKPVRQDRDGCDAESWVKNHAVPSYGTASDAAPQRPTGNGRSNKWDQGRAAPRVMPEQTRIYEASLRPVSRALSAQRVPEFQRRAPPVLLRIILIADLSGLDTSAERLAMKRVSRTEKKRNPSPTAF